jgi:hypothetical protein
MPTTQPSPCHNCSNDEQRDDDELAHNFAYSLKKFTMVAAQSLFSNLPLVAAILFPSLVLENKLKKILQLKSLKSKQFWMEWGI